MEAKLFHETLNYSRENWEQLSNVAATMGEKGVPLYYVLDLISNDAATYEDCSEVRQTILDNGYEDISDGGFVAMAKRIVSEGWSKKRLNLALSIFLQRRFFKWTTGDFFNPQREPRLFSYSWYTKAIFSGEVGNYEIGVYEIPGLSKPFFGLREEVGGLLKPFPHERLRKQVAEKERALIEGAFSRKDEAEKPKDFDLMKSYLSSIAKVDELEREVAKLKREIIQLKKEADAAIAVPNLENEITEIDAIF